MKQSERNQLLSGWLGQVDGLLAEKVLEKGKLVRFEDGATVYGLEQPQDSLYGVANGSIRMLVTMNEQGPRFGHLVGPGFWFGETEVVTGSGGIMEMVTVGETVLLSLSRGAIDEIAEVHQGMWPSLTTLAIMNQGLAIGVAEDLMIRNSTRRLAAVLLRLSSYRNAHQCVRPLNHIPVSWNELAEAANLSRSKVAVILAEFANLGFIRTHQRRIEMVDFNGLDKLLWQ